MIFLFSGHRRVTGVCAASGKRVVQVWAARVAAFRRAARGEKERKKERMGAYFLLAVRPHERTVKTLFSLDDAHLTGRRPVLLLPPRPGQVTLAMVCIRITKGILSLATVRLGFSLSECMCARTLHLPSHSIPLSLSLSLTRTLGRRRRRRRGHHRRPPPVPEPVQHHLPENPAVRAVERAGRGRVCLCLHGRGCLSGRDGGYCLTPVLHVRPVRLGPHPGLHLRSRGRGLVGHRVGGVLEVYFGGGCGGPAVARVAATRQLVRLGHDRCVCGDGAAVGDAHDH